MVFFGMRGAFSLSSLETLLAAGVEVEAVVLPAASTAGAALPRRVERPAAGGSALPLLNPYLQPNLLHLAWARQIPVWEVGSGSDPATLSLLAGLRPEVIGVACFPYIFPKPLLQLPKYGCLNLHPSLLPAYRGPAPLFWLARQGERQAGVTLHFLDEGIDSGDIVGQTALDWPEGVSGSELERRCAVAGADLLAAAWQQLERGPLPRRVQPGLGSSYFPWPSARDFEIPVDWPARRAFNFVRGAENWPLLVKVAEKRFVIRVAIDYDPDQKLDQPYLFEDDELLIQFRPGVLRLSSNLVLQKM